MKKTSGFTTFSSHERGFTLIELLVVVTIIATLAVAVFVALNPAKRIKDAKDARRTSDVNSILTAIHSCIVDGKGICAPFTSPSPLPLPISQIGTGVGCDGPIGNPTYSASCTIALAQNNCLNVAVAPLAKYLKSNPVDPDGVTVETLYTVAVDVNGLVTVQACGTERSVAEGGLIQASR